MSEAIRRLVEQFRFVPPGPLWVAEQVTWPPEHELTQRLRDSGLDEEEAAVTSAVARAIVISRLSASEAVALAENDQGAEMVVAAVKREQRMQELHVRALEIEKAERRALAASRRRPRPPGSTSGLIPFPPRR
jgi:hypothetical protein